jgi:O-6-methylguanine DNA methyltransferase
VAVRSTNLRLETRHSQGRKLPDIPERVGYLTTMILQLDRRAFPLATLLIVTDEDGALRALDFQDCEPRMHRLLARHYGEVRLSEGQAPTTVTQALDAYFAGDLAAIDWLPTIAGGTDFQRAVWSALRRIPAGTTLSYGALAARVGKPNASRAVGLANGSNPVAIVVPCHRVIGANGALTGYAGGMARKAWLLEHERPAPGDAGLISAGPFSPIRF